MKLTINNVKGFNAAFKTAAKIAEKKSTMPVLSHVRLYQEKDKTFLMSTNLETAIKVDISNTVKVDEPGDILIPAKTMKDYSSKRKEGFSIQSDDANWGTFGTMRIALLPSSDFPAWTQPEVTSTGIITNLDQKVKQVFYAAGESDTRYTLNGLYFDFANKRIVGTDGHRLALATMDMNSEKPTIIPREAMKIIQTLKTDPQLNVGEKHTLFNYGNGLMQILTKNIDGTYPNIDNVLPATFNSICAVNREQLSEIIGRVSLVSQRTNAIRMYCIYKSEQEQELVITASNPDIGEAKESLPCTWDTRTVIDCGVNGRFVLDALKAMDCEEVVICYQDALKPLKIVDPLNADNLHIVMPMRTDLTPVAYYPYSSIPDDRPADVRDQIMAKIWQARISRKLAKARERSV